MSTKRAKKSPADSKNRSTASSAKGVLNVDEAQPPRDIVPTGFLISCDIPTKQFILYLNELKPVDKKFLLQDLDATHLLVKHTARDEITRRVEEWLDENVFSAVERVGEDFDVS
jgi:TFIIH basal transcription factor complex TTD-A subunit